MFVSTKTLALMQVVPGASNHAAQVKALIEERHRLPLGTLVGLLFATNNFNLLGNETADRSGTPSGKNLSFPENLTVQAYGHILLSGIAGGRHRCDPITYCTCSTHHTCAI